MGLPVCELKRGTRGRKEGRNKTNNCAIKAKEEANICNWMGIIIEHCGAVRCTSTRVDSLLCVVFTKKRQKKIIVFLMGKSHFGLYILALSLFGKEVCSMYIFLWMDCLQDWFDASMNILNGMKKGKKSFSFDLKQQFFSCTIHNIYLH